MGSCLWVVAKLGRQTTFCRIHDKLNSHTHMSKSYMLFIIPKSFALHFKPCIHVSICICMNVHISGAVGCTETRRGYPLSSLFICSPEAGAFLEPGTPVFCRVNASMSQWSSLESTFSVPFVLLFWDKVSLNELRWVSKWPKITLPLTLRFPASAWEF